MRTQVDFVVEQVKVHIGSLAAKPGKVNQMGRIGSKH